MVAATNTPTTSSKPEIGSLADFGPIQPLLDDPFVEEVVVLVQPDRRVERLSGPADAGNVIQMCVRQQDVHDRQLVSPYRVEKLIDFVAGINDDAFAGVFATDDETVLQERLNRGLLEDHFSKTTA